MKRVYFVRHGQSISNVNHVVQGMDDPLTDEGRHQANRLAERVMGIDFEAFYTSDAPRAVETAKAVAAATKRDYTEAPLFREIRRPRSYIGMSRNTDEYQAFLQSERDNVADPAWQIEDGEHFFAGRDRALAALQLLEDEASDSILVVTHGHFLRYMIATILTEKALSPEVWLTMGRTMYSHNTGITMCVHGEERWQLITWNDIAHFAE